MSGLTDYAQNKIRDAFPRGQAFTPPAMLYYALITASRGERVNSAVYAANDTLVVKIGTKYSMYKCTTAGTSAAALPGTYLAAASEAVTDGTAVMTEQTVALGAGTFVEVTGGSYARASVAASLASFAGTQGAATTAVSSGVDGSTSNNVAISWPAPTGQWHPTGGAIVGVVVFDALAAGNPWHWSLMSAVKNVNNGDAAPSLPAAAWADKIGD